MKILPLPIIIAAAVAIASCGHKTTSASAARLKARFEVAGLCSNYTFSVIEGNIDTSLVINSWTHPQTNKTYNKAFGISNPCDLPQNLKQGDVFYFEIDKNEPKQCAVCMAYYPTPEKKLNIKVLEVIKE